MLNLIQTIMNLVSDGNENAKYKMNNERRRLH